MLYTVILCCLHTYTYSLYLTDGINKEGGKKEVLVAIVTPTSQIRASVRLALHSYQITTSGVWGSSGDNDYSTCPHNLVKCFTAEMTGHL
jgi:hypothetical protein